MSGLYVLAVGDPFAGFTFYGPFVSEFIAASFGEREFDDMHWTVIPVYDPEHVE